MKLGRRCHTARASFYIVPPILVPLSCLARYDQQQMRKLMMKSYEGTEALERRRKQVRNQGKAMPRVGLDTFAKH